MAKEKARMRAETFNMLCAAAALIAVALIACIIHTVRTHMAERHAEEERRLISAEAPPESSVSLRLTDPRRGPLCLCSPDSPWRQEEVEEAGAALIPALYLPGGEVPYFVAQPSLSAQPEALMALGALARDMPGGTVRLQLDSAYLSWAEAGDAAGTSPFHTGYTLRLSLRTDGGERLSFSDAATHPAAAAPAAWVGANLSSYGFVRPDPADPALWQYVGVPHARMMTERQLSPAGYLSFIRSYAQSAPLALSSPKGELRVFYIPADYGAAVLTVSELATVYAVGNGADGFVVTLLFGGA